MAGEKTTSFSGPDAGKWRAIFTVTDACNYRCSYCDVPKAAGWAADAALDAVADFVRREGRSLEDLKFFGGEPLMAYKQVERVVAAVPEFRGKWSLVTNGALLTPARATFLAENFGKLFLSADTENRADHARMARTVLDAGLEGRTFLNLVVDPSDVAGAEKLWETYRAAGFRGLNLLPVYFTKPWSAAALRELAAFGKRLCDAAARDGLRLYGFGENSGYANGLFNNVLYFDLFARPYFSDVPSTKMGAALREELALDLSKGLSGLAPETLAQKRAAVDAFEKSLFARMPGQAQLRLVMDEFSKYLGSRA